MKRVTKVVLLSAVFVIGAAGFMDAFSMPIVEPIRIPLFVFSGVVVLVGLAGLVWLGLTSPPPLQAERVRRSSGNRASWEEAYGGQFRSPNPPKFHQVFPSRSTSRSSGVRTTDDDDSNGFVPAAVILGLNALTSGQGQNPSGDTSSGCPQPALLPTPDGGGSGWGSPSACDVPASSSPSIPDLGS